MKLPTQRALDEALRSLAHRYNGSRNTAYTPTGSRSEFTEFYRGYYHGIDVATRELLRLLHVNRKEWDELLDE